MLSSRACPPTRILLVVTYRPEYVHGWSQKTYYSQIAVHPLRQGMAEELLRDILGDGQGGDPEMAVLRARLIERTEGNPFFLEESLRHLVETGVLAGERGSYRLARALAGHRRRTGRPCRPCWAHASTDCRSKTSGSCSAPR